MATTADFALAIGDVKESVTIDEATPQIRYDSHTLSGTITHEQIENLPLNGRSFMELAKLEPGVQPPSRTNGNRTLVPVLGAPGLTRCVGPVSQSTAVASPRSAWAARRMSLSQGAVKEFQVSKVKFLPFDGHRLGGGVRCDHALRRNDSAMALPFFFATTT